VETGLPAELLLPSGAARVRRAVRDDVPAIVALLADDVLGAARESADPAPYARAFAAVDADPAHLLVVAEVDGEVAGTLQLTVLAGLARRGALRGQLEAVRVAAAHRSSGLGSALVTWAVEEARRRGCAVVQLTTDARRVDAHRFYERLGFERSHLGYKLPLDPA